MAGCLLMLTAMSLALWSADAFLQAQSLDSADRLDESTLAGLLWYISVIGLAGFHLLKVPGRTAMTLFAFAGSAVSLSAFVSSNRKTDVESRIADTEQVWWVAACFAIPALLLLWDRFSARAAWQWRAAASMISLSLLVTWACVMLLPVFILLHIAV